MTADKPAQTPLVLTGCRIAIPESRQLDLFANMLETRGASVLRCPLVSILDAPDPIPVEQWLQAFVRGTCDDLILLTGEGVRRLLGFSQNYSDELHAQFIARLGQVRKITRGPKPARALRDVGLRNDLAGTAPTTDGIIETLSEHDLQGRCVGVQLYGTDPNQKLIDFLYHAGATPKPVAPYVYANEADDVRVLDLLQRLADGQLDAMAFTSSPQVKRLFSVAKKHQRQDILCKNLASITVAAVGPIVAESLNDHGITVDLMPESSYFMKPLVRELVKALS